MSELDQRSCAWSIARTEAFISSVRSSSTRCSWWPSSCRPPSRGYGLLIGWSNILYKSFEKLWWTSWAAPAAYPSQILRFKANPHYKLINGFYSLGGAEKLWWTSWAAPAAYPRFKANPHYKLINGFYSLGGAEPLPKFLELVGVLSFSKQRVVVRKILFLAVSGDTWFVWGGEIALSSWGFPLRASSPPSL